MTLKKYTEFEQRCPRCSTWLPWAEFSKDKSRTTGFQPYCRICDFCRKHNMNRIDWLNLVEQQNGLCAFPECTKPPNELDHNHSCCSTAKNSCGQCIRAALCSKHNMALGQFGDNIHQLELAIKYLKTH